MARWRSALSLPVLDVRYGDLVVDQKGQTRRILDFLGLDRDPACLRISESNHPVLTMSADRPADVRDFGRPTYPA